MKSNSVRIAAVTLALVLTAGATFAKNDAMSMVPADAVTVGVVHLDQLRTSPLSSTLFQHTDKISADGEAARFLTEAGLQPARDVDRLVVATSPRTRFGREAEVLVIAEGRFSVDRLGKALLTRGAEKKSASNVAYFVHPGAKDENHKGAVAFISDSLTILGSEDAVIEALATRASGGSGFTTASLLGQDAGRVDPAATAWAVVDVTRAQRLTGGARVPSGKGQSGEALGAALRSVSTVALWAIDTGDALKLGAFGLSNDDETLMLLEDTIRGALAAMRLSVREKSPEMVSVLRRFDVKRNADGITINGSIPA
ncbi:MAG TPA: hypothetical protein VMS98_16660, partial [Thermoanaerobaculia bacterium]|nr:hypothetical protein [Thermoanaerobaculia bacterium]